jgi:hypothetical protein
MTEMTDIAMLVKAERAEDHMYTTATTSKAAVLLVLATCRDCRTSWKQSHPAKIHRGSAIGSTKIQEQTSFMNSSILSRHVRRPAAHARGMD